MKEIRLTPKRKQALTELGINNTSELISYFPYRYETTAFLDYALWEKDSHVAVEGAVATKPKMARFAGKRTLTSFEVETAFNTFRVSAFNQPWYSSLPVGEHVSVIGRYQGNNRILASQIKKCQLNELLGVKPVYSLKDKLKPKVFSDLIAAALEENRDEIVDFIPESLRNRYGYLSRYDALKEIHFPTDNQKLQSALTTLKYEEFLRFQLYMLQRKKLARNIGEAFRKKIDFNKVKSFIDDLPFNLTADQLQSVREIVADMANNYQMCRLLQGDVGSGKTIVSFIAMYASYLAGCQSCLLAPTEILAKQHYNNMVRTFKKYGLRIELLYSGLSSAERKQILERIENGSADLIVGTHAVFQSDVIYHNLGLVVTDEQHRFGVRQRQALQSKGNNADLLLMSATPIPRTLASSLYGDMDVSTISQTPNSHKVIHTQLIRKNSFLAIVDEIEAKIDAGNQMYVVCATVEKNDEITVRNVNDVYNNLAKFFAGKYRVGLLHGQMSEEEKDARQTSFANGEIDILVTTTVIEVGVDVHKANIMIIYDANRFGLSQLHQLRGRVGRGESEGYCYLLTDSTDEEAIKRLEVIVNNTDGFKIAYYDLEMRGPGDILGYRQSGVPGFILGNVVDDSDLLQKARVDGQEILTDKQLQNEVIRQYLDEIAAQGQFYLD